ncbi:uncharacterized protein LOC142356748 [Convolutriloba macropyga]|uniref:uncharacterized protein LOC142356748 n=1 Tax=Convolutriloba macropyga TaxID=536237 RepID=UPI003F51E809
MTDFESIAADLQSSDYKASNFAQDLATLVNRAMKQFRNVEPEIFSAAMRLDVRLLSLLYQVPRLREEYRQVRSQKADTSSPQRKEKPIKQDSKSNRSPESSKRAKMASSPDARTKVKKDNRNDSGFFDQSISKGTDKQAETKGINDQVSDAAVTPERSTSKSPERTPNAGSLKALTTKVQKVEVNEEVDICNKILQDIKSKYTFQVFQNVSEVSL